MWLFKCFHVEMFCLVLNSNLNSPLWLSACVKLFWIAGCGVYRGRFTPLSFMIQREYQMNNGFSTGEEDSRGNLDQICCLVDDGERCRRSAGNASYSKRIQKTVAQRRLKLNSDPQVILGHNLVGGSGWDPWWLTNYLLC